jgi:predicted nucleotidyltransferase
MDANDYLIRLSKAIGVKEAERKSIDNSIESLKKKIWAFFQNKLDDVLIFGSYDRGTMLSPSINQLADVDILVVFKKDEFQPQTYLNQLKTFAEKTFTKFDVFQDHPTIGVEMEKIRFELVPAQYERYVGYKIPESPGKDLKWMSTNPKEFKESLLKKDEKESGMTIPLVKILKYWNHLNGKKFSPFNLETIAIEERYSGENLKEDFYNFVSKFSNYRMSDEQTEVMAVLIEKRRRLKAMEDDNIFEYVEQELNTFLPVP